MRRVTFDDGSYVNVPDNVKETDLVTLVDSNKNRHRLSWGAIVAQTNGDVIKRLK